MKNPREKIINLSENIFAAVEFTVDKSLEEIVNKCHIDI